MSKEKSDSKEKLELDKIVKKLENDAKFMEKYDVFLQKRKWTFLRINRKEKPLEDKMVYNPFISADDYLTNVCFEIHCDAGFIYNVFTVMAVKYYGDDDHLFHWPQFVSPNLPNHVQTITLLSGEVDVPAMITYIHTSESSIIDNKQARENEMTYVSSNAHLCEKCRCKL